jgi:hypothetical protein
MKNPFKAAREKKKQLTAAAAREARLTAEFQAAMERFAEFSDIKREMAIAIVLERLAARIERLEALEKAAR